MGRVDVVAAVWGYLIGQPDTSMFILRPQRSGTSDLKPVSLGARH